MSGACSARSSGDAEVPLSGACPARSSGDAKVPLSGACPARDSGVTEAHHHSPSAAAASRFKPFSHDAAEVLIYDMPRPRTIGYVDCGAKSEIKPFTGIVKNGTVQPNQFHPERKLLVRFSKDHPQAALERVILRLLWNDRNNSEVVLLLAPPGTFKFSEAILVAGLEEYSMQGVASKLFWEVPPPGRKTECQSWQ